MSGNVKNPATDAFASSIAAASAAEALSVALAGTVAAGEFHQASVDAGRLAGRVEVLMWAQAELVVELEYWARTDRFADLRGLEAFLGRVRDSLMSVQDGTGAWAGLVRTGVDVAGLVGGADEAPPTEEMGD